jgi:small ligand-binding sensory domain FIST
MAGNSEAEFAIGHATADGDAAFPVSGSDTGDYLVRNLVGIDPERGCSRPPRGGLYFSCIARGPNLFGPDAAELRIVRRELGDVPLVGMFCNGEISNNRLYGYTGVLTVFV